MSYKQILVELTVCLLLCLVTYLLTRFGRKIIRWLKELFKKKRGQRKLKPKSPVDCPLCCEGCTHLPDRPRLEIVPWKDKKSRRGRPKIINTNGFACLNPLCHYFAVADQEIHALVSNGCRGKQRIRYFKCQACGSCRTSRYATPLYWLKTPITTVTMVMTSLSEGVDLSAAERIFGHSHTTISHWLRKAGEHSHRLHERLFHQAIEVGHLQLDELVTKVKLGEERLWIWTAVTAGSKLIMALHIGRRSSEDAHRLLHQVWQRLKPECLPIFTSDGLNQYFYGITAHFGRWWKPPRARKCHWLPDPRLLYAQLRKRRRARKVSFLYSVIRLGERALLKAGLIALGFTGTVQTAFVERANLTLRELIAPLSRRTWSIAYDRHHLWLHLQWGLAYYHFCRPHLSLRKQIRGPSKYRHRTPAMAAKLARYRWSVQDLLQLPVPEEVWLEPFAATCRCR